MRILCFFEKAKHEKKLKKIYESFQGDERNFTLRISILHFAGLVMEGRF